MNQRHCVPGLRCTVVSCKGYKPGAPWPVQARISAIRLSTQAEASDKLVVTLHNEDLALFGHSALEHGTTLDFRWGYHGDLSGPRRVFLEEFRGFTELELVFSGRERPLTREAKTRAWPDTTVHAVVREVAAGQGFGRDMVHVDEAASILQTLVQAGETDAAFLQRLAKAYGREFFVDGDGLHWQKPQKCRSPVALLQYRAMESAITEISFSSNLARHVGRVDVRGRDPLSKSTISASKNATTFARDTLSQAVEVVDPDRYQSARQLENAKLAVHPSPASDVDGLYVESAQRFYAAEGNALEARVKLVGNPHIVARQTITLLGVSRYLSGNYNVREAVHTIDDQGYSTELSLRRDTARGRTDETTAHHDEVRHKQVPANQKEPDMVEVIDAERYAAVEGQQ